MKKKKYNNKGFYHRPVEVEAKRNTKGNQETAIKAFHAHVEIEGQDLKMHSS